MLLMGKSTISTAIFNSKLLVYQAGYRVNYGLIGFVMSFNGDCNPMDPFLVPAKALTLLNHSPNTPSEGIWTHRLWDFGAAHFQVNAWGSDLWGYQKMAKCSISWKIPTKNGWWVGVPPRLRKINRIYIYIYIHFSNFYLLVIEHSHGQRKFRGRNFRVTDF